MDENVWVLDSTEQLWPLFSHHPVSVRESSDRGKYRRDAGPAWPCYRDRGLAGRGQRDASGRFGTSRAHWAVDDRESKALQSLSACSWINMAEVAEVWS